jgi:excisionase family DNA binding protein
MRSGIRFCMNSIRAFPCPFWLIFYIGRGQSQPDAQLLTEDRDVHDKLNHCELLRIEEFAAILNIKESTVRAWILRRRIAKVRVGRRAVRIPASEVNRLIDAGITPAQEDRHAR